MGQNPGMSNAVFPVMRRSRPVELPCRVFDGLTGAFHAGSHFIKGMIHAATDACGGATAATAGTQGEKREQQ